MDIFSKKKRSEIMSKIRSSNTRFEQEFIIALKKVTRKKFKTNVASIKGKPDIVFQENKICVFLDSDFWHGWQYPKLKRLLKNKFWRDKIECNRARDRRTNRYLRLNGWKVLRVWEHEIKKNRDKVMGKIVKLLNK